MEKQGKGEKQYLLAPQSASLPEQESIIQGHCNINEWVQSNMANLEKNSIRLMST